jgi:coatomer protein complex subunit alpha (xenin)
MVLLATSNSVVLFDVQQQERVNEVTTTPIKYAYWSTDMSMVALISKHSKLLA